MNKQDKLPEMVTSIKGLYIKEDWSNSRTVAIDKDKLLSVFKQLTYTNYCLVNIGVGYDYNCEQYTYLLKEVL